MHTCTVPRLKYLHLYYYHLRLRCERNNQPLGGLLEPDPLYESNPCSGYSSFTAHRDVKQWCVAAGLSDARAGQGYTSGLTRTTCSLSQYQLSIQEAALLIANMHLRKWAASAPLQASVDTTHYNMLCAHITHIAEHHGGGQGLVSAVTRYDIIVHEYRLKENIMAPLVFNDNTVWPPFLLFLWISGQCN